ncbi:MAG TPA: twin-arginine translocase TatA/TatE family subunit, partial [Anaerolineales bacterium]|nr:twin-arginine translocase TatA/TatE family subunit [Anaerolineales bacterium]
MDILGIGPLELVFVLLIALIVLGPNDMVKAGRTLGRFLRKLVTSPGWQMVQQTSKDLRYLPNKLMREAGLEELKEKMPTQAEISKGIGLDDLKQEVREMDREL